MSERLDLKTPVTPQGPAQALLEATLPTAEAHRAGSADSVAAAVAADSAAAGADIWVASATGELEAAGRFLSADPALAKASGGTRHWTPLLYLCFSRLLRAGGERADRMVEIARLLLDAGADPNDCWIDGEEAEGNRETPLYGAAGIANRPDLAELLMEAGADPNDGETAYHMVEHDGVPSAPVIFPRLEAKHQGIALGHKLDYEDLAGLRSMLELGGDANGPTPFANDPIHQAVWRDRGLEYFELLAEFGADLDRPNREGRTAYTLAARSGKRAIMDWLGERGASDAMKPVDGFIAACAAGNADEARKRLAAEPDLFERFDDRDRSEICEAAASGNVAGVRTMLELGWDVNTRGKVWAETPTHRAAIDGHVDVVRLLAERGADLTVLDRSYRCTPLAWAQHGEKPAVVDYLRTLPERLDVWDAIELGLSERAIELLPNVDANAAMRGTQPGVLLRLAAAHGLRDVAEALIAAGADPGLRNEQNHGPADLARLRGHEALAVWIDAQGT